MLTQGDKCPDFKVTDQNGKEVSNNSLRGSKYIVFFYPKDDSPGCTKQACSVRDQSSKITRHGYKIFGVSPDKEAKHVKFIDKYELGYDLLSDPDKSMIDAFGAWGEKKFMGREITGVMRYTFFIDEDGIITNVINKVKTKEHGNEILQVLRQSSDTQQARR